MLSLLLRLGKKSNFPNVKESSPRRERKVPGLQLFRM